MKVFEEKAAVLLLADGKVFYGKAAGKIGTTTGEICFNTGMTGYQEVFTDPSYYGQIMVTTNVHIGNYGIRKIENQSSDVKIAGLVCRNFNTGYSRKMADSSLQDFFLENNIIAIADVDTRALVNYIRDKGAMNAVISSEETDIEKLKEILNQTPSMEGLELSTDVSTKEPYFIGNPEAMYRVAVLDLGVKQNILDNFLQRDCYLKVFPAHTTYEEMKSWNPHGYFISNGPGDPAAMPYAVETTRKVVDDDQPLFGICLGHQILAQTFGIGTYKLHNGHRGLNHPVKNLITGHCEITSQNHGFGVIAEDVAKTPDVEVTHVNLNDNSVEGIRHKTKKAFSVQYHPEAAPGPHDAGYLFDDFIKMINA
ncbi:MAG: glutamine-hydrolyzing carbamoyl-phosphate synthase small subunit [Bacteroidia bacterium]